MKERALFVLPQERWEALRAALDRPPQVHPRLRRLFAERTVLEEAKPEGK